MTEELAILSPKLNQNKGIKIISLLKIPHKFNKAKNNKNKSLLGTKRKLFKKILINGKNTRIKKRYYII